MTTAILSKCGAYRYRLTRAVNNPPGNPIAWLMLNPSTADASTDDPTIRKVMGFTERAGYSVAVVVNVYPVRATDPKECRRIVREAERLEGLSPKHIQNIGHVYRATKDCAALVCAWGAAPWAQWDALSLVGNADPELRLLCLGTTKSGAPRHPLYVPYSQPLIDFPGEP